MRPYGFLVGALAGLLLCEAAASAQELASTSTYALSFQNQRHIVRAASGTLAMVYQKGSPASSAGLSLVVSRDNGQTWPESLRLVAISNVFGDVARGANDDLYVVHSRNGDSLSASADVGFLKLRYQPASDNWGIERQSVVFDSASTTAAYNAVVAWDGTTLWTAYRFRDSAGFRIVVKYSTDDGATWQEAITADAPGPDADETATFVQFGNRLALIYYHQNVEFRWRWRFTGDAPDQWEPSELIYRVTQNLPSKSSYSAVADDAGRIHLLFASKGTQYMRFDGLRWDSAPVLLDAAGTNPKVGTDGTRVRGVWEQAVGSSQSRIVWRDYDPDTSTWGAISLLSDPSEAVPARAWCYSAAFASFQDVTVPAGNSKGGDVKHPQTTVMLDGADDTLYIGQETPFHYLSVQLKIAGTGGQVAWEYWNGGGWVAFVPHSGAYHFLTKSAQMHLWESLPSVPADWQQTSVGTGELLYYVRARVVTPFATRPVGSQITSIKPNETPTMAARDGDGAVAAWLRRDTVPYVVFVRELMP